MFLASETNLVLALAVVAGVLLLVAIAASVAAVRWLGRLREAEQELAQADRRVEHAERRTFTVLNAVPVALVETDAQGRFVFANKAAHQVLGRRDSELLGLRFHSATWGIAYPDGRLVPPDLLPAARALRGQTVKGFQHMIAHPATRRKLLVAATAMPITNEMGEITGSTTAIVELESFGGSAAMPEMGPAPLAPEGPSAHEILFETAPVPLWRLDAQGAMLGANQAALALNGRETQDLSGRVFTVLAADENDRDRLNHAVQAGLKGEEVAPLRLSMIHGPEGGKDAAPKDVLLSFAPWSLEDRSPEGEGGGLFVAGIDLAPFAADVQAREAELGARLEEILRAPSSGGVGLWRRTREGERFEDQTARALFGRDLAEDGEDLVLPDDQARLEEAFERVFAGQAEGVEIEVVLVRPDGEMRHLSLRGRVERSGDDVVALNGVVFDVTDLKMALNEARAQAEALRQTADSIPALVRLSGTDHEVDLVNHLWRSFTGQGIADAEGQGFFDAVLDEDRETLKETLHAAYDRRGTYRLTYRLRCKTDGTYHRVMESGAPRFALDGSFLGYASSAFDVSEEAAMREALAEREGRYRTLVEAPQHLAWSAKADGGLDYVSPQWTAKTGLTADDLLGTGWLELQHPEDRALVGEAFLKAARTDGLLSVDFRLKLRDGGYRWFRSQGVAIRDVDGKIARWFGACFEVDGFRALAEAENEKVRAVEVELDKLKDTLSRTEAALAQAQRLETVGRLTGGVAHDFNNLLTLIVGALDMIQRQAENPEKVRRLAEAALNAGMRGERFTRQLQAFSRRQEPRLEVMDIGVLVRGFEPMMHRALGGAPLEIQAAEGLGCARIDTVQFESALLNLIMNARDAVEAGGDVTVRAERVRLLEGEVEGCSPGPHIRVAVSDTGVGMSGEVAQRAFDPFFTTKPDGQGSGLGLAQVQSFARACQGGVRLDSAPLRGATVELYLPLVEGEAPSVPATFHAVSHAALEEMRAEPLPSLKPGLRVLLVEEDAGVRAMAEALLTEMGCVVQVATNGAQALAVLEDTSDEVELMLADVVMPGGLNGIQLAKAVRDRHPGTQVLLCTDTEHSLRQEDLEVGFSVLSKPYQALALAQAVKTAVA